MQYKQYFYVNIELKYYPKVNGNPLDKRATVYYSNSMR